MIITLLAVGRLGRSVEHALAQAYAERATAVGRALGVGPVEIIEVEARKPGKAADAAALDAAPAPDDVLGLQADSASPRLRPSAERPAILVARVKCRKFSIVSPYFPDGSGGARSHLTDTVLRVWA